MSSNFTAANTFLARQAQQAQPLVAESPGAFQYYGASESPTNASPQVNAYNDFDALFAESHGFCPVATSNYPEMEIESMPFNYPNPGVFTVSKPSY